MTSFASAQAARPARCLRFLPDKAPTTLQSAVCGQPAPAGERYCPDCRQRLRVAPLYAVPLPRADQTASGGGVPSLAEVAELADLPG